MTKLQMQTLEEEIRKRISGAYVKRLTQTRDPIQIKGEIEYTGEINIGVYEDIFSGEGETKYTLYLRLKERGFNCDLAENVALFWEAEKNRKRMRQAITVQDDERERRESLYRLDSLIEALQQYGQFNFEREMKCRQ